MFCLIVIFFSPNSICPIGVSFHLLSFLLISSLFSFQICLFAYFSSSFCLTVTALTIYYHSETHCRHFFEAGFLLTSCGFGHTYMWSTSSTVMHVTFRIKRNVHIIISTLFCVCSVVDLLQKNGISSWWFLLFWSAWNWFIWLLWLCNIQCWAVRMVMLWIFLFFLRSSIEGGSVCDRF